MTTGPNHLAVLLEGRHVADLTRTRSGVLRLRYHADVQHVGATPLSLSLPLDGSVHGGGAVERFLQGLLPENDGALRAIGRRYRVDTSDTLSLLSAIGKDCGGAVQFCTDDEIESVSRREGSLEPCSDGDIEMRLDEMDTDENASWLMPGEHWSLGGTQQKFALRRQDGRWYVAHGSEATTHIVKPGIRKLRGQALDEHVTMRAAVALGVDAAETDFTSFKSQDAVVVTRFDREHMVDGGVVRLHQEDLCQAIGNDEKYEEFGGPSALDIVELLRDSSATPALARQNVARFVDGLIFNVVAGAPDAHARNYAVMLAGDDVTLAPLYDMASGFAYESPSNGRRVVSMSVGGTFLLDEVDTDAWRRFAGTAGLDESVVLERVAEMTELVPAAFSAALDDIDDYDGTAALIRERIMKEFDRRRAAQAAT
ncbi:serine/threonine-protein kinase HipA [Myceligenerans xiligouense]|uniref:Serine/threonine-protein kinase HipA n=1 Tax=Myceligenerans xiligouense TaxID=253184 RepID=A0A3N4YRD0_9MICO|nr:serine/threonine-protein kinase HipA [Myceligenerans xiligouense]